MYYYIQLPFTTRRSDTKFSIIVGGTELHLREQKKKKILSRKRQEVDTRTATTNVILQQRGREATGTDRVSSFFNHRAVDINKIMQSRISGHSNAGRGKKGRGGEAWNWDETLCSRVVTVSCLKGRVADRDRERERKRDRIIVRGPQRYLLHVWGEGERKNHNGQLGYKLHQPLCGSLNDVSSKEGRGIGPCCWKRHALTFLFIEFFLVPPCSLPFR